MRWLSSSYAHRSSHPLYLETGSPLRLPHQGATLRLTVSYARLFKRDRKLYRWLVSICAILASAHTATLSADIFNLITPSGRHAGSAREQTRIYIAGLTIIAATMCVSQGFFVARLWTVRCFPFLFYLFPCGPFLRSSTAPSLCYVWSTDFLPPVGHSKSDDSNDFVSGLAHLDGNAHLLECAADTGSSTAASASWHGASSPPFFSKSRLTFLPLQVAIVGTVTHCVCLDVTLHLTMTNAARIQILCVTSIFVSASLLYCFPRARPLDNPPK